MLGSLTIFSPSHFDALLMQRRAPECANPKLMEQMNDALAMASYRKYPNAPAELRGQWIFPQERLWKNIQTREEGHHVNETILQRGVKEAVQKAGLVKHIGCHSIRHSFATNLLEGGHDNRTVRELLGHRDVKTTMIYTHVLNRGPSGVRSPIDELS